jgi:hypothetical protein
MDSAFKIWPAIGHRGYSLISQISCPERSSHQRPVRR